MVKFDVTKLYFSYLSEVTLASFDIILFILLLLLILLL
jgi:hypothetical protein